MKRRTFLKYSTVAGASFLIPQGLNAAAILDEDYSEHKLTILHTNDVHSRIEPFPMDGGKNQGQGGIAKRAALLKKIRSEEKNVLLLDAGDMFQGTPYFNYFNGELEIKLMSQLGYDAGTIGNHDFDAGIDNLKKQLAHASFPIINSNYNFTDTIMNGGAEPYKIIKKGPIKIGITGVGVELKGLVPEPLYKETQYLNPLESANKYAAILKNDYNCDYVICLSHLGYAYKENKISDMVLAAESKNIDLIIGGHTHTFLDKPTLAKNKEDKEVLVTQAGWAGIVLGRIDVYFEKSRKRKCVQCNNILIGT